MKQGFTKKVEPDDIGSTEWSPGASTLLWAGVVVAANQTGKYGENQWY